jgi:hypothetical protein
VESDDDSSSESEEEIKMPKGRVKPAHVRKAPAVKKPVARAAPAKNIVNNKKPAGVAQKRIVN